MDRSADLAILSWEVRTPVDCRPREPVRIDVHARLGEAAPLHGDILAVAPDADPRRPQELPMEVHGAREGTVRLGGTLRPTAAGDWKVRVRIREAHRELLTEERRIAVTSSSDEPWEKGPFAKQVLADYWQQQGGALWVGNLASLEHAVELGFDSALNLAEGMDHLVDKGALGGIDYRYLPFADGGHIPLPCTAAIEGTLWLIQRLRAGKKTLVNCRAGIGRSGSLAVLAGAAERTSVGFWEIAAQVKADKDIYLHVDTDRIAADSRFHRAFGGADRPPSGSVNVKRVEIVDPCVGSTIQLMTGSPVRVAVRVVLEGTGLPYVGLRHDLDGYVREPYAGAPVASSRDNGKRVFTYRCAVGSAATGQRWLTAFAAPLGRAIFDVDAADRRWVGSNVYFDVSKDMKSRSTSVG